MSRLLAFLMIAVFAVACGGGGAVGVCEDVQSLCEDDSSEVGKAITAVDCQAEYDKLSDAEKETADNEADENDCASKETCSAAVNCFSNDNDADAGDDE